MIQFYDSTNPESSAIPSHEYAALYYDGLYGSQGRAAAPLYKHHRWITIGWDAKHCGIADFEQDNPVFDSEMGLYLFVHQRMVMNKPRRVYTDRANASLAISRLESHQLKATDTLWWIATGDGKNWTAEELHQDLLTNWDADIPVDHIWGNQNLWTRFYDRSDLFLDW